MNNLTILEKLRPRSFRTKEDDKIEILGAVFLTYSIDCKTILSGLISMFTDESTEADISDCPKSSGLSQNNKGERSEEKKDIVECWKKLLSNGMSGQAGNRKEALSKLQENVAFVCNDGYDKSTMSPIYWYTRNLTYYYKWTDEDGKHSFHPKLYIVKYEKNEELFFRFMIGSMNFVNSKNEEFMVVIDVPAYQSKPDEGEYLKCNVLKELLNLDSNYCSPNINSGQATKLGRVVKNMGLDDVFLEKSMVERIHVFPQVSDGNRLNILDPFFDKNSVDESQSNIILSPFLTKGLLKQLNENTRLYTMESELNKLGYKLVDEENMPAENVECKNFYVYRVKEMAKAFTHIKMYVSEDAVYVGSANFTQSALGMFICSNQLDAQEVWQGKNKEILVRLDVEDTFRKKLEEYLKNSYVEACFFYEKPQKKSNINDAFRKIVEKMVGCLEQRIYVEKDSNVWKSQLNVKQDKLEVWNALLDLNSLKRKWEIEIQNDLDIQVAPFCNRNAEQRLWGNSCFEWKIRDRLKMDECFYFTLYISGKMKVQLKYCIDTRREGDAGNVETTDLIMNQALCYLEQLLENKGTTTSTITKEPASIESGTLRKDVIGYVRRSMPTLETILKKSLNKNELSVESVQQQVERLNQMKSLIEKEELLLEDEKKRLGIDGTNKKIIENLLVQGNALLEELK